MSERRYSDFGRFFQAEDQNAAASFMFGPGVLTGNELTISDDGAELEVAAGAVMTEDGVIIHNDATRDFTISPQADATIFTIVQAHTFDLSASGRESNYSLEEYLDGSDPKFGTYDDVSGGVILGWIRYPGSNVDYEAYMLHPAPPLRVENTPLDEAHAGERYPVYWPLLAPAPFENGNGVMLDLDADVAVAHSVGVQSRPRSTFTNSHAGNTETATLYFTMRGESLYSPRYVRLSGIVLSDPTVSIAVSIVTSNGTTALGTLTGVLSSNIQILEIPDSVFPDASPLDVTDYWTIVLVATLPPTEDFRLRRCDVNAGPLPYVTP